MLIRHNIMKTLLSMLTMVLFAIIPLRAEIKCTSVTNYYGTRVILTEEVDSNNAGELSEIVLMAGNRSYNCLAHRAEVNNGIATYDLMFNRVKDLSNLTLYLNVNDEPNVLTLKATGSIDREHPHTRDYHNAMAME